MALAETANLLVNLVLKDGVTPVSGQMTTSLGGLAKTALSLGGAAGFGAITAGALSAEAAQGKFMAATGASRTEAAAFVTSMDGIVGVGGAIGLTFDQITQAGIAVSGQFHTTGQDTQNMTQYFLDFAKVSGQDVTGAIDGLGAVMKNYGIPLQDTTTYMDELIASHQKFHTSIGPETVQTLQNIGPALQALGGNLNDGIALMNAFQVAGIDSNTAMKDLTAAIKKFPPGTTLNDVITQLGTISDQTARTQKAIEIFGPKIGPALAKVIQPGMTSLDNFKISAQDAGGAVQTAAGDMETAGEKVQGFIEKLGAGAREIGQSFGPALSGLGAITSALGPTLVTGLQKAWDAVKNSSVVQDAASSALDFSSTIASAATGVVTNLASSLITAVTTSWDKVQAWLMQGVTGSVIAKVGAISGAIYAGAVDVAEGVTGTLSRAWVAMGSPGSSVITAVTNAGGLAGAAYAGGFIFALGTAGLGLIAKGGTDFLSNLDFFKGQSPTQIANRIAAGNFGKGMDAAGAQGAQTLATSASDTLEKLGPPVPPGYGVTWGAGIGTAAGTAIGPPLTAAGISALTGFVLNTKPAATAAGADVGSNIGGGLVKNKDAMIPGANGLIGSFQAFWGDKGVPVFTSAGAQAGHVLAQGLEGSRGDVKSAWQQFLKDEKDMLDPMKTIAQLQGELGSKALANALQSGNPLVRQRALDMKTSIETQISQLQKLLGDDGTAASAALAAHIDDGQPKAVSNASAYVAAVNRIFGNLQTNYTIDVNTSRIMHHVPKFASGGHYIAGEPRIVGENGPELDIPDGSGYIVPNGQLSSRGVGMGSLSLNVSLSVSAREITEKTDHYQLVAGKSSGF